MKLGLVTYQLGKDWDVPTLIEKLTALQYEGVELRTEHAHGVEDTLSPAQRAEVRRRFADSPVELVGLGSTFEFHALDPEVVRQNVEGTKRYCQLARDVGAGGVKVRPNGHQEAAGVPREQTLDQIGRALRECGVAAAENGVQIRLEMHGTVGDARGHAPGGRRRRPPQRLALLELQHPLRRRRERLRQVRLRPGPRPDRARPPARPDGRDLPLGGAAGPAAGERVRGLLPGGVRPGVERPGAGAAVLPQPLLRPRRAQQLG